MVIIQVDCRDLESKIYVLIPLLSHLPDQEDYLEPICVKTLLIYYFYRKHVHPKWQMAIHMGLELPVDLWH